MEISSCMLMKKTSKVIANVHYLKYFLNNLIKFNQLNNKYI